MKNVKVTEIAEKKSLVPRVVRFLLASLCRSVFVPGVRKKKQKARGDNGKRASTFSYRPQRAFFLVIHLACPPGLSPKILHSFYLQFLLGRLKYPVVLQTVVQTFGGQTRCIYNGRCANGKVINFPFSGSL